MARERRVITAPSAPPEDAGHLLVVDELRTSFRIYGL